MPICSFSGKKYYKLVNNNRLQLMFARIINAMTHRY